MANIVPGLCKCILLACCPDKRQDEYNLVLVIQFLLATSFALSVILDLCDEDDTSNESDGTCKIFIGRSIN